MPLTAKPRLIMGRPREHSAVLVLAHSQRLKPCCRQRHFAQGPGPLIVLTKGCVAEPRAHAAEHSGLSLCSFIILLPLFTSCSNAPRRWHIHLYILIMPVSRWLANATCQMQLHPTPLPRQRQTTTPPRLIGIPGMEKLLDWAMPD